MRILRYNNNTSSGRTPHSGYWTGVNKDGKNVVREFSSDEVFIGVQDNYDKTSGLLKVIDINGYEYLYMDERLFVEYTLAEYLTLLKEENEITNI